MRLPLSKTLLSAALAVGSLAGPPPLVAQERNGDVVAFLDEAAARARAGQAPAAGWHQGVMAEPLEGVGLDLMHAADRPLTGPQGELTPAGILAADATARWTRGVEASLDAAATQGGFASSGDVPMFGHWARALGPRLRQGEHTGAAFGPPPPGPTRVVEGASHSGPVQAVVGPRVRVPVTPAGMADYFLAADRLAIDAARDIVGDYTGPDEVSLRQAAELPPEFGEAIVSGAREQARGTEALGRWGLDYMKAQRYQDPEAEAVFRQGIAAARQGAARVQELTGGPPPGMPATQGDPAGGAPSGNTSASAPAGRGVFGIP